MPAVPVTVVTKVGCEPNVVELPALVQPDQAPSGKFVVVVIGVWLAFQPVAPEVTRK